MRRSCLKERMFPILFFFAAITLVFIFPDAHADIYRYKDEWGKWHFSTSPSDPRYKLYMRTPPYSAETVAQQKIERAQTLLEELGYNPGSVDGILGVKTRRAIKAFQNDVGLPVTGDIDEPLIERLELESLNRLSAAHGAASSIDNFARVSLPKGVSIEIPTNWVVLSSNQRITLDSAVKSDLDLSGIEQEVSELSLAANYYGEKGHKIGILNVRYYPQLVLTQADARSATARDVNELDAAIKENILLAMKALGMEVISWSGTQKSTINGIAVFITEYRRNSLKPSGNFRVRLVRVLAASKSFTLTVSYHEAASFLLGPITDRIIESLNVEGAVKLSAIESTDANTQSQKAPINLYEKQWGVILLSVLLTWGIGLMPPLFIRFLLMRRPIGKGWAISVVALSWVLNHVFFTALGTAFGSQSKSHPALVLVAFVSYAILRKGSRKQTATTQVE